MKRFGKQLFLALVCVMLCFGIAPTFFALKTEAAQEAVLASGAYGETGTWTLDRDGLLSIGGTGRLEYSGDAPWGDYRNEIKKVVIQKGIAYIGSIDLKYCGNLERIEIPEDTSIYFLKLYKCKSLKSLTLPGDIVIVNGMCYGCTSLESVVVRGGVETIGRMAFYGCSKMKKFQCDVQKSGDSAATASGIEYAAFYGCSSLKSISFPTKTVEARAFEGCTSLTAVNLGIRTSSIGRRAFMNCKSLKKIHLNGVSKIGEMAFYGCTNLKRVELGVSSPEVGAYAFEKCSCTVYNRDSMAEYAKNHKLTLKNFNDIKRPKNVITVSDVVTTVNRDKRQTVYIEAQAKGDAGIEFRKLSTKIWVYSVGSDFGKVVVEKGYCGKVAVEVCSASTLDYAETMKTIYVVVNPDKTTLKSVRNQAGKKLAAEWEANTVGSGYQLQYSTDKNFTKNVTTKMISKNSTTSAAFGGLTKGETYYVRIRTVKKSGKDSLYSGWSDAESVKISK